MKRGRGGAAWVALGACLGATRCAKAPPPEATPRTAPALASSDAPARRASDAAPAQAAPDAGTPRAVYQLSARTLELTLEDGAEIRAALLAQIAASQVEHRELLLERTRNAPVEIDQGQLRIGGWWLQARGDQLQLMQRMGPHPVALFYRADVRGEAGRWLVTGLGPGLIHWKR